jgi:2-keto-4-pentenoate hydratase/2-oxohepta-3-ene-1,7-dioic acid hydratase in catechol pathway
MKIARIRIGDRIVYSIREETHFTVVEGDIFGDWKLTDERIPFPEADLLAPVLPRQIVAIGRNYREHAQELGNAVPEAPILFIKTLNCVVGPGDPILLPEMAPNEVDYEAELVVVIGKEAKNVSAERARDYVLGYTCGNDVSARDCQLRLDKQWARGKCFDTFAPLGPWIETDLDPDSAEIRLSLNGEIMQNSNTSRMLFPPDFLVSYISRCMTLYPGSIIMTGTPSGVGMGRKPPVWLKPGDVVTVEIEGIGSLTNPVEKE